MSIESSGYLETKRFVDFCNERGVETSLSELEYYEEQDILYPAFRIKLKREEIEEAWCKDCKITFKPIRTDWEANPWDETCPECKGHNIGYIIGKLQERPPHLQGKETFSFEEKAEDLQRQGIGLYEPASISPNPYEYRAQIDNRLDKTNYEAMIHFWKTTFEALQYYEEKKQLIYPSKENYRPWGITMICLLQRRGIRVN